MMATIDSIQYTSYLQRSGSYTQEPLDYDNPSYDSPTRSHFTDRQDSLGSPHGSYFEERQPSHQGDAYPEHRNPPPFGGLEDFAPPEDSYNPQQHEDFGYKNDYNQRDPSGVTSGYDSDTLPRDSGGYGGYDPMSGENGHQIPAPEEPYMRGGDGYRDERYPEDFGHHGNDDGYQGDDPGYHGDDRGYHDDERGYPDNYGQDDGSVQHEGYQQRDGRYGDENLNPPVDRFSEPVYPDMNDGDLCRDPPGYDGVIVPEGAPMQEAAFGGDQMGDDKFRAPDLAEVIEYLSSRNEGTVANAAAYLQHLTYGDDGIKNKTRGLNGIPVLVDLLNNPSPEIHSSACGALRNISFGKANEENKVAIKNAKGIPTLVRLLRHTNNADIREMVTGTLWNLSSSEPLKMVMLDEAVLPLLKGELIPETGWNPQTDENIILQNDQPWSRVFMNCLGVIRNVSSGGVDARRRLRKCEGLIDILIHILSGAVGQSEVDTKCVEHAMCIIRNLSYQASREIDHPDTASIKTATQDKKNQQNAPPAGKGDVFSCFSGGKKKSSSNYNSNNKSSSLSRGTTEEASLADSHKPSGVEYMWNLGSIRVYATLLSKSSNPVTLEAAAGTIQNITAGDSRMSINVRAHVRKEKGLPIMVELLRIDNDRVVLALARSLRNLAVDARNKELIGQYAMKDIVIRLPGGGSDNSIRALSMDSLAAVLHLLHEVIKGSQEHAVALRNANGIDAVIGISKASHKYPPPVIKAAILVLHTLWGFRELRTFYRQDGYDERDFLTGVWTVKRSTSQGPSKSPTSNGKPSSNSYVESRQLETHSAPLPVATFPTSSETVDSRRSDYDRGSHHDRDYGYQKQDLHFTDPAAYIRDSYSTHSSEDILDQRQTHEDIPLQDLHITQQDQLSDVGSNSLSRPPVGGVPVYGRAPEPQVESRLPEPGDYRREQTRSPSHESNYASDYGRTDSYRRDDYRHRDDYSHRDDVSQQGSYRPSDYRDGYRDDYNTTPVVDTYDDYPPDKVGPGGDHRREDYGYIAEYGQEDWSHQSGNYSVNINADSGRPNDPNSDSWV